MTLDEAINHCKEKAEGCSECAEEHRQLAEWLEELKTLRTEREGEWIPEEEQCVWSPFTTYRCSVCGIRCQIGTANTEHGGVNYCHKCGSRNRRRRDDTGKVMHGKLTAIPNVKY